MTRNEARADNNLPPIEGGDDLIVPLNVLEGGQASPQDTHMEEQEPMTTEPAEACGCPMCKSKAEEIRIKARSSKEEDEQMADVLVKFWKRQAASVLPKIGAKSAKWWDEDRWNDELTEDIEPLIDSTADAHGIEVAKALGFEYGAEQTRKYLHEMSKARAQAINLATYRKLKAAIVDDDEEVTPAHVFEVREQKDSITFGRALALTAAGWAATREAPQQAEQQGIHKTVEKSVAAFFEFVNFGFFFCSWIVKIYKVLMWAETAFLYQFRNGDFFVDFSTHVHITVPHGRGRIVWRGGGKGNDL